MAKDVKFPVKEVASMLHSVIYDYARCYDTPVKCKHWDQLSEDEKNGIIKGMPGISRSCFPFVYF